MNENCYYGDHDFLNNGRCKRCYAFNPGMLDGQAWDKAFRAGLDHGAHYHRTAAAKQRCNRVDPLTPEEELENAALL